MCFAPHALKSRGWTPFTFKCLTETASSAKPGGTPGFIRDDLAEERAHGRAALKKYEAGNKAADTFRKLGVGQAPFRVWKRTPSVGEENGRLQRMK